MSALVNHLATYAAYHRNGRNVATHVIGVPLIVLSVQIMLSRPIWVFDPVTLSPTILLSVAAAIFYLRLDMMLGAIMAVLLGLGTWMGQQTALMPTGIWIGAGFGAFVVGWVIQLVGHWFEGRKPAFLDDLSGLIIGPLFVVAEILFALGFRQSLKRAIETPNPDHGPA